MSIYPLFPTYLNLVVVAKAKQGIPDLSSGLPEVSFNLGINFQKKGANEASLASN